METTFMIPLMPVLTLVVIIAFYGGGWIAEYLPRVARVFDRKPFNCRPCLTFHMVWIPVTFYGLANASPLQMVVGFVVAFALFGIVKFIDNQMIDK